MNPLPVALIGAGCSGFTTAKRLRDEGVVFDWFEASDRIGGNWAYNNPNGMSSAYQSLHIDTSKWRLAFEDYPVPPDWPDFPHHAQLCRYFNVPLEYFITGEEAPFDYQDVELVELFADVDRLPDAHRALVKSYARRVVSHASEELALKQEAQEERETEQESGE